MTMAIHGVCPLSIQPYLVDPVQELLLRLDADLQNIRLRGYRLILYVTRAEYALLRGYVNYLGEPISTYKGVRFQFTEDPLPGA